MLTQDKNRLSRPEQLAVECFAKDLARYFVPLGDQEASSDRTLPRSEFAVLRATRPQEFYDVELVAHFLKFVDENPLYGLELRMAVRIVPPHSQDKPFSDIRTLQLFSSGWIKSLRLDNPLIASIGNTDHRWSATLDLPRRYDPTTVAHSLSAFVLHEYRETSRRFQIQPR